MNSHTQEHKSAITRHIAKLRSGKKWRTCQGAKPVCLPRNGVPLILSGGTLFMVRHTGLAPRQALHFCPDLTLAMCLVIADLRSCVWEFTWCALCRQSLKHNPLIFYRRKACLGWFWTLCPEKFISSSVSLSFHSLRVDSF